MQTTRAMPLRFRSSNAANDNDEALLVHSYVVSEAADLMRRRLGTEAALAFLRDLAHFTLHWIDASDHAEAVALLAVRNRRGLSLVGLRELRHHAQLRGDARVVLR